MLTSSFGLISLVGTLLGKITPDTIPDLTTLSGTVAEIENPIQVQEGGVFIDIPYLNDLINRIRLYIQLFDTL